MKRDASKRTPEGPAGRPTCHRIERLAPGASPFESRPAVRSKEWAFPSTPTHRPRPGAVPMDKFIVALQVIIALGIINVWVIRAGKATAWRGGKATTMKEEFASYGLPSWFMGFIGSLKLLCAAGLLVGIWVPALVQPAAGLLAALMLGAILMHVKITDPLLRSLPALLMLLACVTVLAG
jgi:hypothetical protein